MKFPSKTVAALLGIFFFWFGSLLYSIFIIPDKYILPIFNKNQYNFSLIDVIFDIWMFFLAILVPFLIVYYYYSTKGYKSYKNNLSFWLMVVFILWLCCFMIIMGFKNILTISFLRKFMDIPASIFIIIFGIFLLITVIYVFFFAYRSENSELY